MEEEENPPRALFAEAVVLFCIKPVLIRTRTTPSDRPTDRSTFLCAPCEPTTASAAHEVGSTAVLMSPAPLVGQDEVHFVQEATTGCLMLYP